VDDLIDLVTTGPEVGGVANRDTAVVVRELFAKAEQSILVAGYAVHQGRRIFHALADRMAERPDLEARLFLNIQRGPGDTSAPSELLLRFAHQFRTKQWPDGRPIPEVFYDPRSLNAIRDEPVALHAKCVVVDGRHVFVSSANFTEAAQERNIEVGLLVHSGLVAERIHRFFECLVEAGVLQSVAGLQSK
jgi:phosphatidylserine/phosphatidylglycerophosphate/cardiolipin synthase-like enzyme